MLSIKDLIQIQRRNQKLYRQAKVKRIQHHQTSSSTNAEGTPPDRTHKTKRLIKLSPNNKVNGNRVILINNYLKCKWIKCSNQKTKVGQMDKTTINAV